MGPMFAGKSTEMLRRVRRYSLANYRVMTVKYQHDTRYNAGDGSTDSAHISTHDAPRAMPATAVVQKLNELRPRLTEFDIIGIDEGQFFPDLAEFCDSAANEGKTVIVAALDGTFERRPFPSTAALLPLAERVTKLTAVCNVCGAAAPFTWRHGEQKRVEVIGGAELYEPVCRTHYMAHMEISGTANK